MVSSVQKEVPPHKLQDHVWESQNPFGLKKDNPLQRNWFKERFTSNKTGRKMSNIDKAKF